MRGDTDVERPRDRFVRRPPSAPLDLDRAGAQDDPMTTYRLGLLKVPVSDVEASAGFYADVLGFELQFAVAEYGWAQLSSGDLPVALYEPGKGGGDGVIGGSIDFHLALDPEPFDRLADTLADAGALHGDQVHRSDDGATFLEARDPDGNTLKVTRAELG